MKVGVIGIIVEGDRSGAQSIQRLLSENSDIISGRMGIPDIANGVSVISLIVRGSNERISALTGKLGRIACVKVKSAVTDCNFVPSD